MISPAARRHAVIALLLLTCIFAPALRARSLVEWGAATEWKFFTGPGQPPADWARSIFDDSKWQSGKAPLGYGTARLTTKFEFGTDSTNKPVTIWFRRAVSNSSLNRGEGLVLLLCVDDGAIVYVNGREITRVNMPEGKVSPQSTAAKTIKGTDEGNYQRIRVPLEAWKADAGNVLAVEVHQAAPNDVDCFFDLALKTLPPPEPRPTVPAEAKAAMTAYYKRHYLGPDMKVPDGYVDGGRRMELDAEGRASSGREILLVDRPHDSELAQDLAFARSKELAALAPLDRVQKIAERIEQRMTPPGGRHWLGPAVDDITVEFADKPLRIGDVVDQGQAGVCRHRSLLFKLMADESGLKAALVRGNVLVKPPHGSPHAWNEVQLDDGTRLLVDVTLNGAKRRFLPVTHEFVVKHYLKPDDSPWYSTDAPAKAKPQP